MDRRLPADPGARGGVRDRAGADAAGLRSKPHGRQHRDARLRPLDGRGAVRPRAALRRRQRRINSGSLLYGRTFGVLGRSANAAIVLPYVWGEIDGFVEDEYRSITRSGLGDLRAQLTVNVLGGPALAPREFASHRPDTILGLSVAVSAPTGQYDPSKLINIGSNRWSFKPEIGISKTRGQWYLELYGGVWFFGTNTNFSRGLRARAGPHRHVPGPPELHVQAAAVAGRERHVLHRRPHHAGWRGEGGSAAQLTPGGHAGRARGAPQRAQGDLGDGLHHAESAPTSTPWAWRCRRSGSGGLDDRTWPRVRIAEAVGRSTIDLAAAGRPALDVPLAARCRRRSRRCRVRFLQHPELPRRVRAVCSRHASPRCLRAARGRRRLSRGDLQHRLRGPRRSRARGPHAEPAAA